MAIRVTCPGCLKRFNVSDKFAGKSGPCPNCKTVIKVPAKGEEVKLHGAEELGAGVRGAIAVKPIRREEAKPRLVPALSICAAVLVVLIATAVLGRTAFFADHALLVSTIGLILVSPPLAIAGYTFLRDEEDLFPHRGRALYVRAAICSAAYIALWGIYAYFHGRYLTGPPWEEPLGWMLFVAVYLSGGGLISRACLDLDFGRGFFHYCFYLFVTVLLRWLAGLGWMWEISRDLPY